MPDRTPLSTLLSQALIALINDFTRDDKGSLPTFAVWANILQYIGDDGVLLGDMPERACLSRRAVRVAIGRLGKDDLLIVEADPADPRAKTLRLTTQGRQADEGWRQLLKRTEQRWRKRVGKERLQALRTSLEKLVRQFELELPHYPTSYGTADPTITGGPGQEWSPVTRGDADTVTGIPLPSLMSQALVGITIDYERTNGPLSWSANIIRAVGPKGLSLPSAEAPSQKSGLVRHRFLIVDTDPTDSRKKRIRLTPMSRQIYDRYLPTLDKIEQEWRARFGKTLLDSLRTSLETVVSDLEPGLPHHPSVTALWLHSQDVPLV